MDDTEHKIRVALVLSALIKVALLGFIFVPILAKMSAWIIELVIGLPPTPEGVYVAKLVIGVMIGIHFYRWIWDVEGVKAFVKEQEK